VWTVEVLVMAVMVAVNSVFAAYEIALASIGLGRLDTLANQRRSGAAAALRMRNNMEASLAVVQLGITLVAAVAAATGGAGAEAAIEPWLIKTVGLGAAAAQFVAIAVVVLPLTVVTIIFGELVPKVFALRHKDWVCLKLSPMMEWFALCVWPAVWFFETSVDLIMRLGSRWQPKQGQGGHSEETALQELRAIAALARMSRLIGAREEGIIVNAARLSNLPIHRIMLPADYISTLSLNDELADALITAHHDMHTRFPVTERPGDPQSIIGYVNFKDIVACMRISPHEPSIRAIVRPLSSLQADQSVSSALEQLIREHHHIALVRDAQSAVVGMVTLEDIIEELVGEIHDEFDRLPAHITSAGTGWVVGGGTSLAQLARITGVELPVENRDGQLPPPTTLNEWVLRHLGRPVDRGEEVRSDGVRILIRKERRQAVQEAHLSKEAVPAEK